MSRRTGDCHPNRQRVCRVPGSPGGIWQDGLIESDERPHGAFREICGFPVTGRFVEGLLSGFVVGQQNLRPDVGIAGQDLRGQPSSDPFPMVVGWTRMS